MDVKCFVPVLTIVFHLEFFVRAFATEPSLVRSIRDEDRNFIALKQDLDVFDSKIEDGSFPKLALDAEQTELKNNDHSNEYSVYSGDKLPKTFDARKKWKRCSRLFGKVWDEGPCNASHAIVAASVVADRICIKSKGKFRAPLSPQKILGCTGSCGADKTLYSAFHHILRERVPTGGTYKSNQGCIPYQSKPCSHLYSNAAESMSSKRQLPDCRTLNPPDFSCPNKCTNKKYKKTFSRDLHNITGMYWLPFKGTSQIMDEIFNKGPVGCTFVMHDDFSGYCSGIYHASSKAKYRYLMKVKLIGWGVENGTDYWLGVNSWNKSWGEKGLFKFPRGSNYQYIESLCLGVTPKI